MSSPAGRMVPHGRSVNIPRPNAGTSAQQDGLNLNHIAAVLWRRRFVFAGTIVIALVSGIVYLVNVTPLYNSSSKIYVQQNTPRIVSDGMNFQMNDLNYLTTQCDLIRSTAILSTALESEEIRRMKSLEGKENRVAFLKKNLTASVGKTSDVITVSCQLSSPEDAALGANAIVDSYIAYQSKRQRNTAGEVLKILQKEKDKYEAELHNTQKMMVEFKKQNGTISFETDRGNIVNLHLAQISEALTRAQLETLNAKVLMDAADAFGSDPQKFKQLLASERITTRDTMDLGIDSGDLWSDYRKMRRAYDQAKDQYGPEHPANRRLKIELDRMRTELGQLDAETLEKYRAVIHQQFAKAKSKEDEIRKQHDLARNAALELNVKAAEFGQLESDAKRAERTLDTLYSRIKEVSLTEDTGQMNVSVLEVARPNVRDVTPMKAPTMAIAGLFGVMMGLLSALAQEWMDQRLRSADEIRATLDVPVLGVIPHISGKQRPKELGQEVHLRPRSDVAESYRTVRTSIYFGIPRFAAKTLLVTSPSPGDGKTTLASNLAIAVAQAGRRVLLIDADCRKPMQHVIFGLKPDIGLSSVLCGEATLEQAVQPTETERLFILPCGPIPANPAEMLNSDPFTDLIKVLSTQFDQIIIDSPPVVAVTDARILAAFCDATVLVLRADKSTRKLSSHAMEGLRAVGANVLGIVVNDVPRQRSSYSYYGYGYGYGYGYSYGYGQRQLPGSPNIAKRATPMHSPEPMSTDIEA